MSDLYFNEESDYFEENTSDNEDCRSTNFSHSSAISVWAWTEKKVW